MSSEALDQVCAGIKRPTGMTWAGACLFTLHKALKELPSIDARLTLLNDCRDYIERREREIERGLRRRQGNDAPSKASRRNG
jgi:hypothetical protein